MIKKNLLSMAALALLASAAQAQVTVYGNVDLSVGRTEFTTGDKSVTAVESGVNTGSYFGLKGEEDLGGGLKAFFALESDIAADTGSVDGNFWGRTSELGLTGGFGTVKLGNSRSLGFLANAAYNPFPVTGLLNTSEAINAYGNRANAITYTSANLSGLTLAAQLAMSETDGVSDAKAVSANYVAGPLSLGFTYSTEETGVVDGLVGLFGVLPDAVAADVVASVTDVNVDMDRWQLGAGYDFGSFKLFGQYAQNKFKGNGGSAKTKFYQLGAAVPVSAAGTVMASYANQKFDDADAKVRDFSLAYDHALSKRTSAYVAYKALRVSVDGEKDTLNAFAVGVKHAF